MAWRASASCPGGRPDRRRCFPSRVAGPALTTIDCHLGGFEMQGTIVMLMALSGLGCHHKSCGPAYAPACYSSCYGGCYGGIAAVGYTTYVAPACYSAGYSTCYGGCYGLGASYGGWGGWDGCYGGCYGGGGGCYGGGHHHRRGLFGGLCGRRRAYDCCDFPMVSYGCFGGCYGGLPVYGSYTPVVMGGPIASGQYVPSGQTYTAPAPGPEPAPTPAPAPAPGGAETAPPPPAPTPSPPTPAAPAAPAPGSAPPAA